MITDSFGRYAVETVRDHALDPRSRCSGRLRRSDAHFQGQDGVSFPGQDEIPDQDGAPGQDEIPDQDGAPGQCLRFRPGRRFRLQAGPPARPVRQKDLGLMPCHRILADISLN